MNCVTALGLCLVVGAPVTKDAPKKADSPGIVGTWHCEGITANGEAEMGVAEANLHLEFTADGKFQFRRGTAVLREGTYSTDPTRGPTEMDFNTGWGDRKCPGIYKVAKDALTLCFADGGGPRPNKFESAPAARDALMTFRRAEKKKD
jgi:uncharacterized protein (TIGR03067 family)